MAASRFVSGAVEVIKAITEEISIPKRTKDANKFGVTIFKSTVIHEIFAA